MHAVAFSWAGELLGVMSHRPPVRPAQLRVSQAGTAPGDLSAQPEALEQPQAVGSENDARADLSELRGLLIYAHIGCRSWPAPRRQRPRRFRHRQSRPSAPS
ncbi:MAG TPA: hypothetical protein VF933_39215, partial [Streptosporangiaceae bacterium]